MREAYACARAVVRVVHKALMAHVPAFLYLFCTHVPAHAVLFAPEAAALHVPRSASHAYSEQVGLGRLLCAVALRLIARAGTAPCAAASRQRWRGCAVCCRPLSHRPAHSSAGRANC